MDEETRERLRLLFSELKSMEGRMSSLITDLKEVPQWTKWAVIDGRTCVTHAMAHLREIINSTK